MARSARQSREVGGYTLVELMIVVVILGVLAALAIPAYQSYVYRTRAAAGPTMLGAIAVRQDAYYAEFGQYVDVPKTNGGDPSGTTPYPGGGDWTGMAGSFTPDAAAIKGKSTLWPSPNPAGWATLGYQPDSAVRMGVISIAGTPGTQPAGMTSDFWFVAAALADLDGDGTYMTMEISSQTGQVSADKDYE